MSGFYIYIIGSSETPAVCKIGLAKDPAKRLSQLQTGHPMPLKIWHTFHCQSREMALHREQKAHKLFSQHRMSGEWFGVSPDDVARRSEEWFCGNREKPSQPACEEPFFSDGFHPQIPAELVGVPISQMSEDDRVRFWACHRLPPPPEGFDDWYVIGSQLSGVLGAFPVEGFICQEPK